MESNSQDKPLNNRNVPLEMSPEEFRKVGHQLIDRIAELFTSFPQRPVTPGESSEIIRQTLGNDILPLKGTSADRIFEEATNLLFEHSLFNGHPRFWGYITSSASPIGVLGDLLASAVNPNVGASALSPMATEIEAQTIRWLTEFIGYPSTGGGLLVSGGNMANFVGFLAGRTAKVNWNIREEGMTAAKEKLRVYVSKATHTWIEKAADLFGLGTRAIRWIDTDLNEQMDIKALEQQILSDRADSHLPIIVVGTAGTVSTGAIDPLPEIAAICQKYNLWFHVDGAYGAPAAALQEASAHLRGLTEADSVALDPHKWLYSPLEAGCVLAKNPQTLIDTFSYHPDYYSFNGSNEDPALNYYEFGLQNSRGFKALKVWLGLRQAGRSGYIKMIRDDIALSKALYQLVDAHSELQAFTQNLSITTFRYVPKDLQKDNAGIEAYLNDLNEELINQLQANGEVYISNAVIDGKYVLRACIVNFRTTLSDIEALPEIVIRAGQSLDAEMRPDHLSN